MYKTLIDPAALQRRVVRCDGFRWLPTLRVDKRGQLDFLDPMTQQTLLDLVRSAFKNYRICVEFSGARWVVYEDRHGSDIISRGLTEAGALVRALEKAHGEMY